MSLAQKLYEEGLITYHRTDSVNLSQAAVNKVRNFVEVKYGKSYVPDKPRFYKKTSKLAQEAHEAIRPTDVNAKYHNEVGYSITNSKFIDQEQKLYDLVWKRFVACQMANCVFDETVIDVEAKFTPGVVASDYLLRASGQVLKFDGWRKVIPLGRDEEPELPLVQQNEELTKLKVLSEIGRASCRERV